MNYLKGKSFSLLFVFVMVLPGFAFADFQKRKIKLASKTLIVEIAKSPREHEVGLMFRDHLGENEGMLFVFEKEDIRFFWMKNTLIDLSIGFFDKNGILVDIQEMKSGKGLRDSELLSYPSHKPARYALELNKGWYDKNHIKVGAKIVYP